MPIPVQLAIVFAVAACVGMLINWAIYRLAWDKKFYSPLGPRHPDASPRKVADFIPIFGWLSLKREEKLFGVAYWTRPLAIEFMFATVVTGMLFWHLEGGLHGLATREASNEQYWIWFFLHAFLLMLLVTATFIDFDEKTIPDQITVTGTVVAIAYAAFIPDSRLPIQLGAGWSHIQLNSPSAFPAWAADSGSLWIALGCFVFWCLALLPWPRRIKFGKFGSVKYFWAIMLQPPRKGKNSAKRPSSPLLIICPVMAVAGVGLICFARFSLGAVNWESLMSSILGMTFGLVFVWLIRLIAGHALAKEAMGFGDVTLMAMIGAFLGWQAALLTFAFAPFAAVLIAIGQLAVSKKTDLAFGPYLSLAAIVLIFGWATIWNDWASQNVFMIGHLVLIVIGGSLVLMYLMLAAWGGIRDRMDR